jgi:putative DNA primase/helicase
MAPFTIQVPVCDPLEYTAQLRTAMHDACIVPPDQFVADGRLHRFSTNGRGNDDAGWYVFHADGIPAGAFGDWRSGMVETWNADIGRALSPQENAIQRERMDATRREYKEERQKVQGAARTQAERIWNATSQAPDTHPYLRKKGVKSHGLQIHEGKLLVPVREGSKLHSLQLISETGDKRFLRGGRKRGCYFLIGDIEGPLCITEGYATGASVYEATGHAVAIGFDAGNLLPVAQSLRRRLPGIRLILCADDDANTMGNPGLTKAKEAAEAVGGLLAVPDFGANRPSGMTDFNDLHRCAGLKAVRACIERAPTIDLGATAVATEWPELVRLDAPSLPRLDLSHLPSWAGDYARALAAATEAPPELPAGMVLITCAAATARRLRVMVERDYFEPCNLWVVVALAPGNRKSAVQSAATAPLVSWEHNQCEALEPEIKRLTSERKTLEARAKEIRNRLAKETDIDKAEILAREVEILEAELPDIPKPTQLWTSDATPERLGCLLAENSERLAWLSSEGGLFELLQGRYSKGIPNLDLVLKTHSGDAERVDRGSRPPVYLRNPLLSIGLSPQPDVLRGGRE